MNTRSAINRYPRPLARCAALFLAAALTGCGATSGTFLPSVPNTAPVAGIPAGPMLGFVWSSTDNTLRPILGVTGSALVGQSITPAGAYVAGAASSASNIGLVEDASGTLFSLALPSSSPTQLATSLPPSAQIIFSPSGGSAIAYAVGGSSATVLTNLASKPQVSTISIAGAKLSSAIISDANTILAAAQGSPVQLGILSLNGQLSRIASVTQAGGMSFLPGADDALVADNATNKVSLLHNVSGSLGVQAINAPGVNQPLALASTQDARWAVVANGGDQNVLFLDLKNGGAPTKLTCNCQSTQLSALAGGKSFRVNALGSGPLWMADASGSTPQLLFVPAIAKQ